LRTQQKHAHDQRAKDTQVARLKTPIIVPSFKQKKLQFGIIEELITERGHKAVFLPKFHCEINPIEMYWGYSKTRFRQVKKVSFPDAKVKVIEALEACSIETIRRFCNRTFRWMDAYRKGLSIKQAAWCVKKQKRHRTISKRVMDEWDNMQKQGEAGS
jgi:transposase